jgi:hypothetical protein
MFLHGSQHILAGEYCLCAHAMSSAAPSFFTFRMQSNGDHLSFVGILVGLSGMVQW